MANSKKNVNSKNWSSGAISLTENYLIKINRSLILNQLDFFNLVKNKKSKILDIGCGFGYFLKCEKNLQNVSTRLKLTYCVILMMLIKNMKKL